MPSTVLITGGAGNLSRQLADLLLGDGDRVVLFDLAPPPSALPAGDLDYVRGDVTRREDLVALFEAHRPQRVLHMASLLSGKSEEDRARGWEINATATFQVLDLSLRYGVERFFFPSSIASFGSGLPDPLPEDHSQWPEGWYGVTKVACERMGVYYHRRHGLDFRCLRIPQVISRFANPGAASAYASQAFLETVRTGHFTFVVNPETRCPAVYIRDILTGIRQFVNAPAERLTRRVYNLFAMAPQAWELAQAIQTRVPTAQISFAPDPAVVQLIESWPRRIDDRSARADWDWAPQYDLEAMADDFLCDLRATPPTEDSYSAKP